MHAWVKRVKRDAHLSILGSASVAWSARSTPMVVLQVSPLFVLLCTNEGSLSLCVQIKKAGCNVLLIQKSILRDAYNDLSLHFLAKMDIMVISDVERTDIEFIRCVFRPPETSAICVHYDLPLKMTTASVCTCMVKAGIHYGMKIENDKRLLSAPAAALWGACRWRTSTRSRPISWAAPRSSTRWPCPAAATRSAGATVVDPLWLMGANEAQPVTWCCIQTLWTMAGKDTTVLDIKDIQGSCPTMPDLCSPEA
jgi:hypothetical protein